MKHKKISPELIELYERDNYTYLSHLLERKTLVLGSMIANRFFIRLDTKERPLKKELLEVMDTMEQVWSFYIGHILNIIHAEPDKRRNELLRFLEEYEYKQTMILTEKKYYTLVNQLRKDPTQKETNEPIA